MLDTSSIPNSRIGSAAANNSRAMLWRYVAVDLARTSMGSRTGELAAESAADVRASLRRIGLQAIDVRPLRARRRSTALPHTMGMLRALVGDMTAAWHRHVRTRRRAQRAEVYDSLATMLESGLPLLEAVQTLAESGSAARARRRASRGGRGGRRGMLVEVRERLRSGDSLAHAMREHAGWFDSIDVAIVEAGQHGGTLPIALASLAQREERSSDIAHKVWGALAYPLLVLLVGLGVVVFLSVKTLPNLTKILIDNGIAIPGLTARVMWLGQTLAANWLALGLSVIGLAVTSFILPRIVERLRIQPPGLMRHVSSRLHTPRLMRQMLVGSLVVQLGDLLRSGVPIVESLRVLAPAQRSRRLRQCLNEAADRIEHGGELSEALGDRAWFDSEMQRLLDIGQTSGDLDVMLARIGERYQRRSRRIVDRLTSMLEPVVLLLLALMVGAVVMAAILPLLALQEII